MLSDVPDKADQAQALEGKTRKAAPAIAGLSERRARKVHLQRLRARPSSGCLSAPRRGLVATTLLEVVQERSGGRFSDGHVRTLHRRLRDYRAIHGPEKDAVFLERFACRDATRVRLYPWHERGVTGAGRFWCAWHSPRPSRLSSPECRARSGIWEVRRRSYARTICRPRGKISSSRPDPIRQRAIGISARGRSSLSMVSRGSIFHANAWRGSQRGSARSCA